MTEYEVETHKLLHAESAPCIPEEAMQLLQIVNTYKTAPHDDR